jgi:4-diphosphocytidyl-2-C-methyl-D-erythritol kinase
MSAHQLDAYAKINLVLAVTGRRDDGYHLLRSVFLRLALYDRLGAEVDRQAAADHLLIDGELEASADNLVLRAAAQLRAAIDPALPPLRFELRKRIPTAAGLGGGSSDAAAAIDLALAAWGQRLPSAERLEVALRVGADVPFFSSGHAAALVEGIGERIAPLPAVEPAAGVVLITPRERLSTATVFAQYDRLPAHGAARLVDEIVATLRQPADGATLAGATPKLREANDLWSSATRLSRGLEPARAAAARVLERAVLMTGSGPTLVALYPSEAAATRAAVALQAAAPPELDGAEITTTSTM